MVPYTYPDFSGSGRNAFYFGKFLSKRNIPVSLLTFNRGLRYKRIEKIEGLDIQRIAYLNKNLLLKILSLIWILPIYFFRIYRSDIVYVFGGNLIAWQFVIIFSFICKRKVIFRSLILGEDDIKTLTSKSMLLSILNIYVIRHLDCYFSIHPGFSAGYLEINKSSKQLLELPQGTDIDTFHPVSMQEKINLRKKLGIPETEFIIISAAFLIKRKGFDEIFEQLQQIDLPFKYFIIGEYDFGEYHFLSTFKNESVYLRNKGSELLGSRFELLGPKENINEYFQSSDLCLFNSTAEGLPNSMLEAMACGIGVVSNPISGLEGYLLQHKKNCLVYSKISDLNNVIKIFYNDQELRRSIEVNASKTIVDLATFDVVINSIYKILGIE